MKLVCAERIICLDNINMIEKDCLDSLQISQFRICESGNREIMTLKFQSTEVADEVWKIICEAIIEEKSFCDISKYV